MYYKDRCTFDWSSFFWGEGGLALFIVNSGCHPITNYNVHGCTCNSNWGVELADNKHYLFSIYDNESSPCTEKKADSKDDSGRIY